MGVASRRLSARLHGLGVSFWGRKLQGRSLAVSSKAGIVATSLNWHNGQASLVPYQARRTSAE